MKLQGLKICYLTPNPNYSRNRIITKALVRAGAKVTQLNDARGLPLRAGALFRKAMITDFDVLLVGFPGHLDMPLAKLIGVLKKKPVIFDVFLSQFDSNVLDRQQVAANSPAAQKYYFMDQISCRLANLNLLDTDTHISFFVENFNLPKRIFRRLWLGADDEIMYPRKGISRGLSFKVFFYGSFIPLQGIEYIIQATKLLATMNASVELLVVGSGQTYPSMRMLAEKLNINHHSLTFKGQMPYEDLPELMSQSHLCLGIFGTTPKTQRVIPNKVFDGLAMGLPVITADTPAVREVLTHGENVHLCPPGDARSLAEAIITLKENRGYRKYIADNGYSLFREKFSIGAINAELENILNDFPEKL